MSALGRSRALVPEPFKGEGHPVSALGRSRALMPEPFKGDGASVSAPLLVIAVGNPSRGDDGLGAALLVQLAASAGPDVDTLLDYQLQVEHALDLLDRRAVLFVDAARTRRGDAPAAGGQGATEVAMTSIAPAMSLPALSHALTPSAVLHVAQRLGQPLPDAWQLAIEGESFELGEGLSDTALRRLGKALELARRWLQQHRQAEP